MADPVISNVTPTPGGALAGSYQAARGTPIVFDVTDPDTDLLMVVVSCRYDNGPAPTYVVFDGSNFVYPFDSDASTRTEITDGYRFTVRPRSGWLWAFNVWVYAMDQAGNLENGLP